MASGDILFPQRSSVELAFLLYPYLQPFCPRVSFRFETANNEAEILQKFQVAFPDTPVPHPEELSQIILEARMSQKNLRKDAFFEIAILNQLLSQSVQNQNRGQFDFFCGQVFLTHTTYTSDHQDQTWEDFISLVMGTPSADTVAESILLQQAEIQHFQDTQNKFFFFGFNEEVGIPEELFDLSPEKREQKKEFLQNTARALHLGLIQYAGISIMSYDLKSIEYLPEAPLAVFEDFISKMEQPPLSAKLAYHMLKDYFEASWLTAFNKQQVSQFINYPWLTKLLEKLAQKQIIRMEDLGNILLVYPWDSAIYDNQWFSDDWWQD
jgi:hypothetical protein